MGVDFFEGLAQPLTPLAVEVADRAAQAVDGFGQFRLLGQAFAVAGLGLGQCIRSSEAGWAAALACSVSISSSRRVTSASRLAASPERACQLARSDRCAAVRSRATASDWSCIDRLAEAACRPCLEVSCSAWAAAS